MGISSYIDMEYGYAASILGNNIDAFKFGGKVEFLDVVNVLDTKTHSIKRRGSIDRISLQILDFVLLSIEEYATLHNFDIHYDTEKFVIQLTKDSLIIEIRYKKNRNA